jgi:hypothetical protein
VKGAVMLPPDIQLPDGTEVELRIPETSSPPGTLADSFHDFIGLVDGPPDLARNHDHYAHGAPRK